MPYIKIADRKLIDAGFPVDTAGELNYLITSVLLEYIKYQGKSYQTYNECIGALECAKLELYRRMVVPYEERKIDENGDVYDRET